MMERQMILELLLKDKSNDELIERPELYSIEEDIYQWMLETRNDWNKEIPRLMEVMRKIRDESMKEAPEEAELNARLYTEEYIRRAAHRQYRRWRGHERCSLHGEISCFWRRLLTKRPEFADCCPWNSFRGDHIWWALKDDEFCNAIGIPKKELALKMPLKIMSRCDWDELLKIVPELKPERDRLIAEGYKFEAYCL